MKEMQVDAYDKLVDEIKEAIFWILDDNGVDGDADAQVEEAACQVLRGLVKVIEE